METREAMDNAARERRREITSVRGSSGEERRREMGGQGYG
jgi:hypothetical protein